MSNQNRSSLTSLDGSLKDTSSWRSHPTCYLFDLWMWALSDWWKKPFKITFSSSKISSGLVYDLRRVQNLRSSLIMLTKLKSHLHATYKINVQSEPATENGINNFHLLFVISRKWLSESINVSGPKHREYNITQRLCTLRRSTLRIRSKARRRTLDIFQLCRLFWMASNLCKCFNHSGFSLSKAVRYLHHYAHIS